MNFQGVGIEESKNLRRVSVKDNPYTFIQCLERGYVPEFERLRNRTGWIHKKGYIVSERSMRTAGVRKAIELARNRFLREHMLFGGFWELWMPTTDERINDGEI